jgi:hypothetical protein
MSTPVCGVGGVGVRTPGPLCARGADDRVGGVRGDGLVAGEQHHRPEADEEDRQKQRHRDRQERVQGVKLGVGVGGRPRLGRKLLLVALEAVGPERRPGPEGRTPQLAGAPAAPIAPHTPIVTYRAFRVNPSNRARGGTSPPPRPGLAGRGPPGLAPVGPSPRVLAITGGMRVQPRGQRAWTHLFDLIGGFQMRGQTSRKEERNDPKTARTEPGNEAMASAS